MSCCSTPTPTLGQGHMYTKAQNALLKNARRVEATWNDMLLATHARQVQTWTLQVPGQARACGPIAFSVHVCAPPASRGCWTASGWDGRPHRAARPAMAPSCLMKMVTPSLRAEGSETFATVGENACGDSAAVTFTLLAEDLDCNLDCVQRPVRDDGERHAVPQLWTAMQRPQRTAASLRARAPWPCKSISKDCCALVSH